jgi:hypothetical protein
VPLAPFPAVLFPRHFDLYSKVLSVSSASPERPDRCQTSWANLEGLISRFGQFYKSVDPGLVQVNVCSEEIKIVGMSILYPA